MGKVWNPRSWRNVMAKHPAGYEGGVMSNEEQNALADVLAFDYTLNWRQKVNLLGVLDTLVRGRGMTILQAEDILRDIFDNIVLAGD